MGYFKTVGCVLTLTGIAFATAAIADDAAVLPKGRWRVRLVSTYTDTSSEFNSNGDIRSTGSLYSKQLNARFLASLSPDGGAAKFIRDLKAVQPGLADSLADLNIATLTTDVDSFFIGNNFVAEYGITDRISVGAILPVIYGDVTVKAVSNPDQRFEQVLASQQSPQMKAALNQLKAATTVEGLNAVLGDQFAYSAGLKSWSGTGLGDLELGAKINYLKAHPLLATLKIGTRLPTGREDDPNQLVDVGFGDGQIDVGAFNYIDYNLLSNLWFTLETGYTAQLPNTSGYRLLVSEDLPIGARSANLERDLGDYWEAGLEGNIRYAKYFSTSAKYRFKQKFKDQFKSSDPSIDVGLLESRTDELLHEISFTSEYTNLPAVRAGQSKFPYAVGVLYRQPIAGKNIADSRTAGVQLKAYF